MMTLLHLGTVSGGLLPQPLRTDGASADMGRDNHLANGSHFASVVQTAKDADAQGLAASAKSILRKSASNTSSAEAAGPASDSAATAAQLPQPVIVALPQVQPDAVAAQPVAAGVSVIADSTAPVQAAPQTASAATETVPAVCSGDQDVAASAPQVMTTSASGETVTAQVPPQTASSQDPQATAIQETGDAPAIAQVKAQIATVLGQGTSSASPAPTLTAATFRGNAIIDDHAPRQVTGPISDAPVVMPRVAASSANVHSVMPRDNGSPAPVQPKSPSTGAKIVSHRETPAATPLPAAPKLDEDLKPRAVGQAAPSSRADAETSTIPLPPVNGQVAAGLPEVSPDRVSDRSSIRIADRSSDHVSDHVSDHGSDRVADGVPSASASQDATSSPATSAAVTASPSSSVQAVAAAPLVASAIPAADALPAAMHTAAPEVGTSPALAGASLPNATSSTPGTAHAQASEAVAANDANSNALPPLQTVRLVQHAGGAEMRVGMQSGEFGAISIKTSTNGGTVSAQISLEHPELARSIAAHLPEVQTRLVPSPASEVRQPGTDQGAGTAPGSGQQQQSRDTRYQEPASGSRASPGSAPRDDLRSSAARPIESYRPELNTGRLDLRV